MENLTTVQELEKLREKITKKTTIIVTIAAVIILILLVYAMSTKKAFFFPITIFTFVISLLVNNLLTAKETNKYNEIYKKVVVLETLKEVFDITEYNPNEGIDRYEIAETRMMSTGDRYHSNDYMIGKYKNINFKCADVHIETEHEDSDGDRHYSTLFRGQWMIFDFNKTFKANIQICERFFAGAMRGNLFSKTKYHKVNMEDVEFNKQFKVYAQDEHEAFYILTPGMMQRILQLNNDIPGKTLFCLKDNKLHIGLHNNKDLFEPNVYKKVDLNADKEKIVREMKTISSFVDILDLDNDLFKEEI